MMREIENPMVIDSLWDELDQVDEIEREEREEEFYRRIDEEYDEDVENRLSFFAWSKEQDGYHF